MSELAKLNNHAESGDTDDEFMLDRTTLINLILHYGIQYAVEVQHVTGDILLFMCVHYQGNNAFYQQGEGLDFDMYYLDLIREGKKPKNRKEWQDMADALLSDK